MTRLSSDMTRLSGESRELLSFVTKHFFSKVPSMSALAGILMGAWVSSTFSTPPVRSMMALFGIMDGGATGEVASPMAYRLFSIFLTLFAAAATVYAVQKALKSFRKRQLAKYAAASSRLEAEKLQELNAKLALLEEAKNSGLLTSSEHETKLGALYQGYMGKLPTGVEEFIVKKLTS